MQIHIKLADLCFNLLGMYIIRFHQWRWWGLTS